MCCGSSEGQQHPGLLEHGQEIKNVITCLSLALVRWLLEYRILFWALGSGKTSINRSMFNRGTLRPTEGQWMESMLCWETKGQLHLSSLEKSRLPISTRKLLDRIRLFIGVLSHENSQAVEQPRALVLSPSVGVYKTQLDWDVSNQSYSHS